MMKAIEEHYKWIMRSIDRIRRLIELIEEWSKPKEIALEDHYSHALSELKKEVERLRELL